MTDYDFHDSMIQVEMIFQSHVISFGYKEYSLETYVDRGAFAKWKANEACADTDEMRTSLNIDGILRSDDPSAIEVLTYLQYVLNIAELARRTFNREEGEDYGFDIRIYTELLSKVREILKVLNYELRYSHEKEFIYLLPFDPASDLIGDKDDSWMSAVTEYRSELMAPSLERKRELLVNLGSEIERLPDNLSPEHTGLYSRIEFLLNNVNLRPRGEDDGEVPERIASMDPKELEEWYDETFRLIMLHILTAESGESIEKVDRLADECGIGIHEITRDEIDELLGVSKEKKIPSWAIPNEEEIEVRKEKRRKIAEADAAAEEEVRRVVKRKKEPLFDVRKVIWTVIIADLIFVVFLLFYFFLF